MFQSLVNCCSGWHKSVDTITIIDFQVHVIKVNFVSLETENVSIIGEPLMLKLQNMLDWFVLESKWSRSKVTYS